MDRISPRIAGSSAEKLAQIRKLEGDLIDEVPPGTKTAYMETLSARTATEAVQDLEFPVNIRFVGERDVGFGDFGAGICTPGVRSKSLTVGTKDKIRPFSPNPQLPTLEAMKVGRHPDSKDPKQGSSNR
jgi:hypothetical protein